MAKRRPSAAFSPAVAGVLAAIGFVYYFTVFVLLDARYGLRSSAGATHAVAYTLVAAACLFSFFIAAVTDPGSVPSSFSPEIEDPRNEGTGSRYCDKCNMHKPPRSHHCKVCKRCVLKMDHHCTWLSNCVGFGNYKPFIILVLNATTGSIYSMVIYVSNVLNKEDFGTVYMKIFYILGGCIVVLLTVVTGSLLLWHLYLMSHNMTTIEFREAGRAKWLAKKSGHKYHHLFDLGIFKNLIQILGPNVLLWLCPTSMGHLEDGTKFEVVYR